MILGEHARAAGLVVAGEGVEVPEDQGTLTSLVARTSTMSEPTSCCRALGGYCKRCDLLVGLDGLHVTAVDPDCDGRLVVGLSRATLMGCPTSAVVAHGRGRVLVRLVDAPSMGRPLSVVWRKRRWVCRDPGSPARTFVEQDELVAAPRSSLTTRACRWAIRPPVPSPATCGACAAGAVRNWRRPRRAGGVPKGERAQERPQPRRRVRPCEDPAHPTVPQQSHVIDVVCASDHPRQQRGDLQAGVCALVARDGEVLTGQPRQARISMVRFSLPSPKRAPS